jgi:hypothetical protein
MSTRFLWALCTYTTLRVGQNNLVVGGGLSAATGPPVAAQRSLRLSFKLQLALQLGGGTPGIAREARYVAPRNDHKQLFFLHAMQLGQAS